MTTHSPPTHRSLANRHEFVDKQNSFFYGEILDHVGDAIVVVNKNGMIQFVNSTAEQLLGKLSDGLLGQRFPFPILLGTTQEVELQHEGEQRIAEMNATPMIYENRIFYIIHLRDITAAAQQRRTLHTLSLVDELTGLYNRRGFMTLAQQQLKMMDRMSRELYLLYADFDRLKHINDTLGHREGDAALFDIATILITTFRKSDILARIGGDEFVVLAAATPGSNPTWLRDRLREAIKSFNVNRTRPYQLALSIGVCRVAASSHETLEELLHRADELMYVEKRQKRAARGP